MKTPAMISGQGVMFGFDVQATAATHTCSVSCVHAAGSGGDRRRHTPEQADRQRSAADYHGDETLLGNDVALFLEFALEARQCDPRDDQAAEHDPDEDA